jgi:DNA polymerase/3'-5' exonuclease PolX
VGLRPDKVLRLYKDLGVTSLAELEQAAKDATARDIRAASILKQRD